MIGSVFSGGLRRIFAVECILRQNTGLFALTVLRGSSPGAAFSFLSGSGADPTGRSRMPFARYKGEAENALLAAGFPHGYLFRPAYIYPVEARKEPNFSYRFFHRGYALFLVLVPHQSI